MRREFALDRRLRSGFVRRGTARPAHFRAHVEQLEVRQMLAGSDLLISTYDSFYGTTVFRYDATTWTPTSGTVATGGAENAGVAYGLAAAPDGSFFVSNNAAFPGQVLHFDVDGQFVDVLGESDPIPFSTLNPYFAPGTMTFGPNGHLYVADLGTNSIYEFDAASASQQFIDGQGLGYQPGGFTFAADGSNDLIVGGLMNHTVTRYSSIDNSPTILIDPDDPDEIDDIINPSAILALPNNNLLIGDFTFGGDEFDHHRIVKYDATAAATSTFITLTEPIGTGAYEGFPAQPSALLFEPGGATFLVGVSPDHNLHGAVLRFDTDTGAQIGGPLISGIGTPSGLAFTSSITSVVTGRHIFYNQSAYDGTSPASAAIDFASDELARAPDKTAYLPGDPIAVAFNITSYSRGINGIMVDLSGGGAHASISASDFVFKVGSNNLPSSWAAAPSPASVAVSLGGGVSGSDRVEITWASGSITNKWLEVQVLPTANTGLASTDVFFWGNKIGDSASGVLNATNFITNTTDAAQVNATLVASPGATITDPRDFNRDKSVNTTDSAIVNAQLGNLNRLLVGSAGPFAPAGGGADGDSSGDAGIASALAASTTSSWQTGARFLPVTIARRLALADWNHLRIAAYFHHLGETGARRPRAILPDAEPVGEPWGLDDEVLDALLGDTGLK